MCGFPLSTSGQILLHLVEQGGNALRLSRPLVLFSSGLQWATNSARGLFGLLIPKRLIGCSAGVFRKEIKGDSTPNGEQQHDQLPLLFFDPLACAAERRKTNQSPKVTGKSQVWSNTLGAQLK